VRGMRLIMPRWSDRLAPRKRLAAAPQRVRDRREPIAARETAEHLAVIRGNLKKAKD